MEQVSKTQVPLVASEPVCCCGKAPPFAFQFVQEGSRNGAAISRTACKFPELPLSSCSELTEGQWMINSSGSQMGLWIHLE